MSQGRQVGQSQGWFAPSGLALGLRCPRIATGVCIACEGLQCAQREAESRLTLESPRRSSFLLVRHRIGVSVALSHEPKVT